MFITKNIRLKYLNCLLYEKNYLLDLNETISESALYLINKYNRIIYFLLYFQLKCSLTYIEFFPSTIF